MVAAPFVHLVRSLYATAIIMLLSKPVLAIALRSKGLWGKSAQGRNCLASSTLGRIQMLSPWVFERCMIRFASKDLLGVRNDLCSDLVDHRWSDCRLVRWQDHERQRICPLMDTALGMVGAVVGGWIFNTLGIYPAGGIVVEMCFAVRSIREHNSQAKSNHRPEKCCGDHHIERSRPLGRCEQEGNIRHEQRPYH
jgi:hypothetical protein